MTVRDVPLFLFGTGALGATPVAVLDLVTGVYVLRVLRRRPGDPFAALPLALFFTALAALATAQALMMSLVDTRASFFCNYVLQSVSVVMTAPPLVAFAYSFLGRAFPREARVVVLLATAVAVAVSLAFFVDWATAGRTELFYNFAVEHEQRHGRAFEPLEPVLPAQLVLSYAWALVVLVRKARLLSGPQRGSALAFAAVIVAAIVGVAVNRLEASRDLLPVGTYTAYVLSVSAAAFLTFVMQTDGVTRFHDRITALVLVAMLAATVVVAERGASSFVAQRRRARAEVAALVAAGAALQPRDVVLVRPALPGERSGDTYGDGPLTGVVLSLAPTPAGAPMAVGFSTRAAREALDSVVRPDIAAILLAALLVLLLVPVLAERVALGPLRTLERADAESKAKSAFLAAMSHELKTPLNAILHHARVLAGPHDADPVEVRERAEVVAASAEHLLALIEALLVAGRADAVAGFPSLAAAIAPEPTILADVVDDAAGMHEGVLERRRLALDVSVDAPGPLLLDRRMLRQVVANLVGNAARHAASRVTLRATAASGRVTIVVRDDGPGVPPAARARIFEAFFQAAPGDGVGLGLAITRQLAEALGGTLRLEEHDEHDEHDEAGGGAAFVVDIEAPPAPAHDAALGLSARAARAARPTAFGASSLPAAVRDELLALARVGDVVALERRARELAAAADTADFGASLARLAARFQVRAIRRMLGERAEGPP